MVYFNIISSSFTSISSCNYCSSFCCIYVCSSWYRYIYSSMVFRYRCVSWVISWSKIWSNICTIYWPFHYFPIYCSVSRRYCSRTRTNCSTCWWHCYCCSISTNIFSSKIWIIKITPTIYNFCNILIPFWVTTLVSRIYVHITCISSLFCAIPWIFIYNKFYNILPVAMSPLIATCIILVFYISYNTLYYASIFLIKIYIVSHISICWCTSNYISSVYSSKPFFVKIHSRLLH